MSELGQVEGLGNASVVRDGRVRSGRRAGSLGVGVIVHGIDLWLQGILKRSRVGRIQSTWFIATKLEAELGTLAARGTSVIEFKGRNFAPGGRGSMRYRRAVG